MDIIYDSLINILVKNVTTEEMVNDLSRHEKSLIGNPKELCRISIHLINLSGKKTVNELPMRVLVSVAVCLLIANNSYIQVKEEDSIFSIVEKINDTQVSPIMSIAIMEILRDL